MCCTYGISNLLMLLTHAKMCTLACISIYYCADGIAPEKPTNIMQSLVYESQGLSCNYDPPDSCRPTKALSMKNAKGKINDLFTNTSKNVKCEWCYANLYKYLSSHRPVEHTIHYYILCCIYTLFKTFCFQFFRNQDVHEI